MFSWMLVNHTFFLYWLIPHWGKKIFWYKSDPSTQNQWLHIIQEIRLMEKLTYALKLKEHQFLNIRKKWIMYLNKT